MASPAEFVSVLQLVFQGAMVPIIDRILALGELAIGHRALESGEVFGKVVIRI
jgi:NADPH:quinone reductase-like Zn-dependent oxidoreductase